MVPAFPINLPLLYIDRYNQYLTMGYMGNPGKNTEEISTQGRKGAKEKR
jgi:hypothetical protein